MRIVVALFALVAAAVSQPNPATCRHETTDPASGASVIFSQLHLIRPTDNNLDFTVQDTSNQAFSYNFRICENVVQGCGSNGATPVCQKDTSGNSWSLGTLDTQFILDFPSLDKSRGVMIEYTNGTICPSTGRNRRILLTIECDPNSVGPISALSAANHQNQDPCEYELYARSQYACPEVSDNVCAGQKGCTGCTLLTGCGWCAASQRCVLGNAQGPLDGSLCLGTKSYNYNSQLDCTDCAEINSCSECGANPNCKWCNDGGCIPYFERECEDTTCKCPSCRKGYYCPPEGGDCRKLANSAGLFVGGMFLGFGIVGIAAGGYAFFKKRSGEYQGLA